MQTEWRLLEHPAGNLSYCCEFRVYDRVAVSGCLRVQPRWMELLLPEIGNLPMRDLAIPGTHQSGTFKAFSKFDYLNRYRDCQEENVFTQLLYGIRALDLRPGAVSKSEYFTHKDADRVRRFIDEHCVMTIVHCDHAHDCNHDCIVIPVFFPHEEISLKSYIFNAACWFFRRDVPVRGLRLLDLP